MLNRHSVISRHPKFAAWPQRSNHRQTHLVKLGVSYRKTRISLLPAVNTVRWWFNLVDNMATSSFEPPATADIRLGPGQYNSEICHFGAANSVEISPVGNGDDLCLSYFDTLLRPPARDVTSSADSELAFSEPDCPRFWRRRTFLPGHFPGGQKPAL